MSRLILASASPRRSDLLAQINIKADIIDAANIDETALKNEKPLEYVKRMAREKLAAKQEQYSDDYIITADTIVTTSAQILPKAQNEDDVKQCLKKLSGKQHSVISCVYLYNPNNKKNLSKTVTTKVKFKRLSNDEINEYAKSNEGIGKAGGYAIQGLAQKFIKQINGSFSNVVGLPLHEIYNMLSACGYESK